MQLRYEQNKLDMPPTPDFDAMGCRVGKTGFIARFKVCKSLESQNYLTSDSRSWNGKPFQVAKFSRLSEALVNIARATVAFTNGCRIVQLSA